MAWTREHNEGWELGRKGGARAERRRIRALQRAALRGLKCITCDCEDYFDEGHGAECSIDVIKGAIRALDKSTRAPRKRGK